MPAGGIQPSTSLLKSCTHIHLFKVLNNPASHCNLFCVDFYSITDVLLLKEKEQERGRDRERRKDGRKKGKRKERKIRKKREKKGGKEKSRNELNRRSGESGAEGHRAKRSEVEDGSLWLSSIPILTCLAFFLIYLPLCLCHFLVSCA